MVHPLNLGENLLIRDRCPGELRQCLVLPYLPGVLVSELYYRPATNNRNHNQNRNPQPKEELPIDCPELT